MSTIIEALQSAVEHRERVVLDDIDAANLLAVIDRLHKENAELFAAMQSQPYEEEFRLRAELIAAKRTAEYWKAKHLADNAELTVLKNQEPVGFITDSGYGVVLVVDHGFDIGTSLYAAPKPGDGE